MNTRVSEECLDEGREERMKLVDRERNRNEACEEEKDVMRDG